MYKTGNITELTFPILKEKILRNMGFIFVDNTNLITIGREEETVNDVIIRQQEATSQWEKLLEITGGALKPSKYYWYLVDFKFKHGEWSYADTTNVQCMIQGEGSSPYPVKSLAVNESREIMGVWQNLSGENTKQIEETIKKHLGKIRKIQT